MPEAFQRLLSHREFQVESLNVQAARGPVHPPERSQFSHLLRHFIERFFNHETASPDGDAKTRMVQIACATGLPGLMVAVYLWPVYHPFKGWPPGSDGSLPSYWLQVSHHFFFVVYSFVAMGIVTVFEWDLFFPDQLDIFVLGPLPVAARRMFLARVAAISVFIAGFLFDTNFLAPCVLPAATDPPNLVRFLAGHLLAVTFSGLFAAIFILALQGLLLSALGEQLFRRLSLLLQGISIAVLLMLLLLFPVMSGVVPALLQSNSLLVRYLPPFWFLGIYQRVLEGPAALPIYGTLAQIGIASTLAVTVLAALSYPIAYTRRVRRLVEGSSSRSTNNRAIRPLTLLLHATVVRPPVRRAVFHFISQTLLRVPRYRIYLVLYGGAGLSVVVATVLRFTVVHGQVHTEVSADGIRVSITVIAFWVIAGMRMAFASNGNQRGSWIFRIVHGRPPQFHPALQQLLAAKTWVLITSLIITITACFASRLIAPPALLTWPAVLAQFLMAIGICVLLTDAFFLNVTSIAFTGKPPQQRPNLALSVLQFVTAVSFLSWFTLVLQPALQSGPRGFLIVAALMLAAHLLFRHRHREIVRLYSLQLELEDDEEDFPMKLGLRY
jgi:hypothetical protein